MQLMTQNVRVTYQARYNYHVNPFKHDSLIVLLNYIILRKDVFNYFYAYLEKNKLVIIRLLRKNYVQPCEK